MRYFSIRKENGDGFTTADVTFTEPLETYADQTLSLVALSFYVHSAAPGSLVRYVNVELLRPDGTSVMTETGRRWVSVNDERSDGVPVMLSDPSSQSQVIQLSRPLPLGDVAVAREFPGLRLRLRNYAGTLLTLDAVAATFMLS